MEYGSRGRGAPPPPRSTFVAPPQTLIFLVAHPTRAQMKKTTPKPVTGCTHVSDGCDNCYAQTLANRLLRKHYTRRRPAKDTRENRRDPFAVRLWPERLSQPFSWRGRQRVFVNSMSDLFHVDVPDAYVRRVFDVM